MNAMKSRGRLRAGARGLGQVWRILRAAAPLALLVAAMAVGSPALAQLNDDGMISTEGTQFVGADPVPRPKPPKVEPTPVPVAPAPARVAPVAPPPQPPPSRFPSVVILLDTSDSMLNRVPGGPTTRLDEAKQALTDVVRGMSAETQMQLWVFNSRLFPISIGGGASGVFIPVGRAGLRDRLIRRISNIRTGGGTNLYRAVIKTLDIFAAPEDQFAYRTGQRFPVLVIISDGEDAMKTGHTVDAVLAARRRFPLVTINTIGFHVKGDEKWYRQLCRLATSKKGCATAGNRKQLKSILEGFYRYRG